MKPPKIIDKLTFSHDSSISSVKIVNSAVTTSKMGGYIAGGISTNKMANAATTTSRIANESCYDAKRVICKQCKKFNSDKNDWIFNPAYACNNCLITRKRKLIDTCPYITEHAVSQDMKDFNFIEYRYYYLKGRIEKARNNLDTFQRENIAVVSVLSIMISVIIIIVYVSTVDASIAKDEFILSQCNKLDLEILQKLIREKDDIEYSEMGEYTKTIKQDNDIKKLTQRIEELEKKNVK